MMTKKRAGITVASDTRKIELQTPLDAEDESAWLLLLVPNGWSDERVLEAAEVTLPAEAVTELRERIEQDAAQEKGEAE